VTRTIEIGADADLGSWTSIGSLVRRDSIKVGGRAFNGESASCGFNVDDDAAAKTWPPHRVVRVIEDATTPDTTLGWGRVETDSSGRNGRFAGDARSYDVNLSDRNADVRGIVVTGWNRPAETDVARMRALVADWFDGSYRASTNLTDTYVRNANTVTLPAKKYDAVQANEIAQEIADAAGKIWFVTVDGELFLDTETSTAYAAAISITDAGTDNQTTIFAPGFDADGADRDKTEVLSGGVAPYGAAGHRVSERRSAKEAAGDRWEEVLSVDASTSAGATSQLGKLLDARQLEDLTVRCFLDLRADQVDVIKYGQTLSFRGAAAATTSPTTLRIAELTWEEIGKDLYRAHLELARPTKLGSRNKKGSGGSSPVFDPTPVTGPDPVCGATGGTVVATIELSNGAPDPAADHNGWSTSAFHPTPGRWYTAEVTVAIGQDSAAIGVAPSAGYVAVTWGGTLGAGDPATLLYFTTSAPIGEQCLLNWPDVVSGPNVWHAWPADGTLVNNAGFGAGRDAAFGIIGAAHWGSGAGMSVTVVIREYTNTIVIPPVSGQLVTGETATPAPDGTTTTFATAAPYAPGSLRVLVDNTDQTAAITSQDPTTGSFTLAFAPKAADATHSVAETVVVSYIAA
jgi:hypothetical protein